MLTGRDLGGLAGLLQSGKTYLKLHRQALEALEAKIPPLIALHRAVNNRRFSRKSAWARMFRGVYGSFGEAIRAAPKNLPIGYDNTDAATFLIQDDWKVLPSDYPVMFWLARALPESMSVFDFGGYVGISYYSYKKYLNYLENLRWQVYDVPAVTRAGEELAARNQPSGLRFTNAFEDASDADILLACGSLQFVETPLSEKLVGLRQKPKHILLNKLPLYRGKTFVTLQNMGPAVCPYYVFNDEEFIGSIRDSGYDLVDRWENPEFGARIPFHPENSVERFSGLYFRRK
ncbi:MAG: TIGR04325 family methyltransferase [Acidobacteriota bacterium]|nr:TIGR04325 family methyltransferase [Acidobacteriota bacterium]